MELLIALVGGICIAGTAAVLQRRGRRRSSAVFDAAAAELGGQAEGRALRCTIGEIDLVVDAVTTGSGGTGEASSSGRPWVRYSSTFAPWCPPVRMRARTVGAKLDGWSGRTTEAPLGLADFDRAVLVLTDDPTGVRDALGQTRRHVVLDLLATRAAPNEVTESSITTHIAGPLPRDADVIVSEVRELVERIELLLSAPPQNRRLPSRG